MSGFDLKAWEKSVDRHFPAVVDVLSCGMKMTTEDIAGAMGLSRCLLSTVLSRMKRAPAYESLLCKEREVRTEPGRPKMLFFLNPGCVQRNA